MEPLDSDLDYMVRPSRPAGSASRTKALLILPILGTILVVIFVAAAIFQLNLSDLVDSLMGLLMLFFILTIVMLFWALSPRADHSRSDI
jgi:hypothetical protein